ncbi:DsbA family protein [uncultured Enterovirga sp.]|uniref:DsbA family protein n=1 Tax=uncultured Enterovirga sp. TaxID=2026352 RepID=UPI0035CB3578
MTAIRLIDRRRLGTLALAGGLGLLSAPARAQAANQWFAVMGDNGQPVPNYRAPVELVEDIEDLPGAIWAGPRSASVKLIEFYDYNCPWCRAAEKARDALRMEEPDLRVGLVNNPILSPASAAAAKVDLALLTLKGAGASYGLHRRLFETPGRIDGPRALDAAVEFGAERGKLETLAASSEIGEMLARQQRLAASLGISATPSYVVGGATVLGYPGAQALARIVASARRCGSISC